MSLRQELKELAAGIDRVADTAAKECDLRVRTYTLRLLAQAQRIVTAASEVASGDRAPRRRKKGKK